MEDKEAKVHLSPRMALEACSFWPDFKIELDHPDLNGDYTVEDFFNFESEYDDQIYSPVDSPNLLTVHSEGNSAEGKYNHFKPSFPFNELKIKKEFDVSESNNELLNKYTDSFVVTDDGILTDLMNTNSFTNDGCVVNSVVFELSEKVRSNNHESSKGKSRHHSHHKSERRSSKDYSRDSDKKSLKHRENNYSKEREKGTDKHEKNHHKSSRSSSHKSAHYERKPHRSSHHKSESNSSRRRSDSRDESKSSSKSSHRRRESGSLNESSDRRSKSKSTSKDKDKKCSGNNTKDTVKEDERRNLTLEKEKQCVREDKTKSSMKESENGNILKKKEDKKSEMRKRSLNPRDIVEKGLLNNEDDKLPKKKCLFPVKRTKVKPLPILDDDELPSKKTLSAKPLRERPKKIGTLHSTVAKGTSESDGKNTAGESRTDETSGPVSTEDVCILSNACNNEDVCLLEDAVDPKLGLNKQGPPSIHLDEVVDLNNPEEIDIASNLECVMSPDRTSLHDGDGNNSCDDDIVEICAKTNYENSRSLDLGELVLSNYRSEVNPEEIIVLLEVVKVSGNFLGCLGPALGKLISNCRTLSMKSVDSFFQFLTKHTSVGLLKSCQYVLRHTDLANVPKRQLDYIKLSLVSLENILNLIKSSTLPKIFADVEKLAEATKILKNSEIPKYFNKFFKSKGYLDLDSDLLKSLCLKVIAFQLDTSPGNGRKQERINGNYKCNQNPVINSFYEMVQSLDRSNSKGSPNSCRGRGVVEDVDSSKIQILSNEGNREPSSKSRKNLSENSIRTEDNNHNSNGTSNYSDIFSKNQSEPSSNLSLSTDDLEKLVSNFSNIEDESRLAIRNYIHCLSLEQPDYAASLIKRIND